MYHALVRVHHIALRTRDLAALERFYAGVLGLTVSRARDARSAWLDAGGTILMLERADEDEPGIPSGSKELIAFAIDPGERSAVEARLARAGVSIEGRTDYTIYFRDPDGRRVGVSHYPRT
jgi:catechol-2,3-dioxygenase